MISPISNHPFVKEYQGTFFYKPAKAFLALTAVALVVAAVAAVLFVAGPYMATVAIGALCVAKWTLIVAASAALLALGCLVGKKGYQILCNKLKSPPTVSKT